MTREREREGETGRGVLRESASAHQGHHNHTTSNCDDECFVTLHTTRHRSYTYLAMYASVSGVLWDALATMLRPASRSSKCATLTTLNESYPAAPPTSSHSSRI